uniref:Uncharacterized protein n=1 Tax=Callithrix jacchus TaxID=9483 RepID=A0A5F4WKD2_CALJA
MIDTCLCIPDCHVIDPGVDEALRQGAVFKHYRFKQFSCLRLLSSWGHRLKDALIYNKFKGQLCSHTDFKTELTKTTKCYIFCEGGDGQTLMRTAKGATGNHMVILMHIKGEEKGPEWGETCSTVFQSGVRVQLHDFSEPQFAQPLNFGFAGIFKTFTICQEQIVNYLIPPWEECKYSKMGQNDYPVSELSSCYIRCESKYIVRTCNCHLICFPADACLPPPHQHKEGSQPSLGLLATRIENYCLCKTGCALSVYNKELSLTKIRSGFSASWLDEKFSQTPPVISENLLVLGIFFEAINHFSIENKKRYSVSAIALELGGEMHLQVGAARETVMELFLYVYEILEERLLSVQGREETEGQLDSNKVTCFSQPSSSETITHKLNNLPLVGATGPVEEPAC